MLPHRHDGFADNVGEIGADCEIPIQTDCAQSRPGNKTSTYSKKSAQNADYESDDDQINRADVRTRDRKKHSLFRAPTNQPQQKRGHILENHCLADHEKNGDHGVAVAMVLFQLLQSLTQEMQNEKKIGDDEHGINGQLNQECAQRFGRFLFHAFQTLRVVTSSRSCGIMGKSKFCCSCRRLWRQNRCVAIPIALTIAGSDSSAGAGIQADLKTFSALGVYGLSAVTCVVAEIPGKVSRIEPISVEMVREQIDVLAKHFPIAAIKTGLLCSAAIISAVTKSIVDLSRRVPLVIDPVIIATSGDSLLESDAIETYKRELFRIASLITPNLDEAAQLLGDKIQDRQSMKRAGKELERKFKTAILLKGGHLGGDEAVDLLFANGKVVEFAAPFVRDVATHGTGCTYSAAITAGLAAGLSLEDSIARAKKFVTACIANHLRWKSNVRKNIDALNHSFGDAIAD